MVNFMDMDDDISTRPAMLVSFHGSCSFLFAHKIIIVLTLKSQRFRSLTASGCRFVLEYGEQTKEHASFSQKD